MECYYHPSRESTDVCAICGKSICKECGLEIAGKIYCKDCLEKIVGLSINNNQQQTQTPQKEEPIRLEKQETPEQQIEMANLTKKPEEVQFSNQKVADDSPYNIKDNIQYESGLESSYQPKTSVDEALEEVQVPQKPVQDVRQEYVQEEVIAEEIVPQPADQARNEYDYSQRRPQAPPADDYIYPDHSYDPGETSARQSVESKYERYLDDLYFDEEEIPLNEQLARDEEKYGSLTRDEYQPRNAPKRNAEDDELERRIREELARRDDEKRRGIGIGRGKKESIHNFQYEEENEGYSAVDILLTIILIIVIIIVLFYILYIFKLSAYYPTFVDAILGLGKPGTFVGVLFG
ncbi:hypothetical protein [Methanobrevibacter sp.]|uniref:hypothetical protein n=1 Tax=Methanobrevibacter sp. TaxID=66852 RepID=UPI00388FFBE9